MKLEVHYHNQTHVLEVKELEHSHFRVTLHRPGGEQVMVVRVLSRHRQRWSLEIDGRVEDVLVSGAGNRLRVDWRNRAFPLQIYTPREKMRLGPAGPEIEGVGFLKAQMPGRVISVLACKGDRVEADQGLVVIEAMKMQNELRSPKSGTIVTCNARQGETVRAGDLLFEIE